MRVHLAAISAFAPLAFLKKYSNIISVYHGNACIITQCRLWCKDAVEHFQNIRIFHDHQFMQVQRRLKIHGFERFFNFTGDLIQIRGTDRLGGRFDRMGGYPVAFPVPFGKKGVQFFSSVIIPEFGCARASSSEEESRSAILFPYSDRL